MISVKKINQLLYHDKYFALLHWIVGVVIMGLICCAIHISGIALISELTSLVNSEVISLAATISGFELAGVALLISLNGNEKFQSIKKIGSDKTIYKLFFHSIMLLTVSLLIMVFDINLLKTVPCGYAKAKEYIEYFAVLFFGQGVVFFLSSVRMLLLIFK